MTASAQVLDRAWSLDADTSNIRFQSVKNQTVVESSSFATFAGAIETDGTAEVRVALDSVDTKIDLRNVRMRFLFFETFKFPEAVINVQITPEMLEGLAETKRKTVTLPFTMDLHGVTKELTTEAAITLITDDMVSVASAVPLSIAVADFDLNENIGKLEEAAGGISIIPSATVTFDFVFNASESGEEQVVLAAVAPGSAALEAEGNFDREACVGRFEILSRTGNIYFNSGSARLDSNSEPLLNTLLDIVNRCPDLTIEVQGHTDSVGSDAVNQQLSQARAQSVARWLSAQGASSDQVIYKGYGEAQPVATNDTAEGRSRNRRIEFAVLN
ncbi:MAG: OmpA family protein [Pseudomonadota bacterium]